MEQDFFDAIDSIFMEKISIIEDHIDMDIIDISISEYEEIIEKINPILFEENIETNLEEQEELKRHMHTLKGSLRMAGLNKCGMLAHRLESLMDYIEEKSLNFNIFKKNFIEELDKIKFLMSNKDKVLLEQDLIWLDNLNKKILNENSETNQKIIDKKEDNQSNEVKNIPQYEEKKEIKQLIRVPSLMVDNVISDAGSIRLLNASLEDSILNNKKSIAELKLSYSKLNKMVKEIEVQAESQIQSSNKNMDENNKNFDPLEFDRFTRLQELTRLMGEVVSDIESSVITMDKTTKVQNNLINEQSIANNNMLSELMKVRLVNLNSVAERFYKIVKNVSKELNKEVELEIYGDKIEIDKILLDKIINPIEHILRNSIAHGIETSAIRINKGKKSLGKISLNIDIEGNYITIKITDDGAGINIDKVKSLGIEKRLIEPDQNYDKSEIVNLIFHSGFSTADNISQVSGRGVGMDVVKSEILSVGGRIEINTEKDIGTSFILTLPVDVATNNALLAKIKEKLIAIPAVLIDEVISLNKEELESCYISKKLKIRNLDFYYIGHILGLVDVNIKPKINNTNNVLIIKYGIETIAVHFDKIIGTHEIIVKQIGSIYSKIQGVLGATILGDGTQGVIINPVQLLNYYKRIIAKSFNTNKYSENKDEKIKIMVIDDSITVRKASSIILERNGFSVILAKDGEDALEKLSEETPSLILSDIEMPRMDGFEFLKVFKNIEKYEKIPVIMITSRTADKHKEHAESLGASGFLGKPYVEKDLILTVKKLLEIS